MELMDLGKWGGALEGEHIFAWGGVLEHLCPIDFTLNLFQTFPISIFLPY
jgi:hypothetical protein